VRAGACISLNISTEAVEKKNEIHVLYPLHFLPESEGFGSNQAKGGVMNTFWKLNGQYLTMAS
jgi:hypothetical protein